MGCGVGKSTKEAIVESSVPSTLGKSRTERVIGGGDKLAPEVVEGLGRIFKRFAVMNVGARPRGKGKDKEGAGESEGNPPVPNTTVQPKAESDLLPRSVTKPAPPLDLEKHATEAAKPTYEADGPQQVFETRKEEEQTESLNPTSLVAAEKAKTLLEEPKEGEEERAPEPRQAFEEGNFSSEDQRISPEPPRPLEYSDDEAQPYEDESLRLARLEMERQAREEAERRAAEQRLLSEEQANADIGKLAGMENEAKDILSKYQ